MPDQEWAQLSFEKGLNVFDRASVLDDGEAQAMENFEPLPNGGATPRPVWKAAGASPSGSPSSKRGRGIFTGWYESGVRKLVVATYDNSANFITYKTDVSDPTAFTSYTQIDTVAVSAAYRSLPMAMAIGNNALLMSNPGMTSAFMRYYDGSAHALADAIAGRSLVYFLNRFWTGGAIANPTYLRFSEIGSTTNWNTSENFLPVAQDDGEPIEDIVIWDRGLLIGKQHSLHFLSGYTIDNFALAPVETHRVSVAPGRTMVPTEHGVFILGIDGNAYLYDGSDVMRITKKISVTRPTSGYGSAAWCAGKLILTGNVTPTVAYVYDGTAWRKETYADTANAPQAIVSYDDRYLIAGSNAGTRLLSVREETGAFSISGNRDPSGAEVYTLTTKEWWPRGPIGKGLVRSLYVRYHQWVGGTGEKLVITPVVNGVALTAQAKSVGGKAAAGDYAERVDFAAGVNDACYAFTFSASPSAGEPTYTIDEVLARIVVDSGQR